MLIGEVAKKTGFTSDTIRWYEKIGIIQPDETSRTENNYRNYKKAQVEQLHLIKQMKSFGFTLKEIKSLLGFLKVDVLNCENAATIIDPKIEVINQKITELTQLKSKLLSARERCTGNCIELFDY